MIKHTSFFPVALIAGLLSASPQTRAGVGSVLYVFGQVQAIGKDGQARALVRGNTLEVGETLKTLKGHLQLRFSDGGLVALEPNTRFTIDDYAYSPGNATAGRTRFELARGGIRFLTGAIGSRRKDRYSISTPAGTIGVGGSGGRANMCVGGSCPAHKDGLYLTGERDDLVLTNRTGRHTVHPGDTEYTACRTCSVDTLEQGPDAHIEIAAKANSAPEFVAAEQRGSAGIPEPVADAPSQFRQANAEPTPTPAPDMTLYFTDGSSGSFVGDIADAQVFDDGSFIVRWTNGTATFKDSNGDVTATVALGPEAGFHFFGGTGPLDPLPASGQASYAFVAGTRSTQLGAATVDTVPGTFLGQGITSGTMYVDFLAETVAGNFKVTHGDTYSVSAAYIPLASDGSFTSDAGGAASATGGSGTCATACAVDLVGGLQGPADTTHGGAPTGLDLGYTIHEGLSGARYISGVGYFGLHGFDSGSSSDSGGVVVTGSWLMSSAPPP